jgi:hypothetical protein
MNAAVFISVLVGFDAVKRQRRVAQMDTCEHSNNVTVSSPKGLCNRRFRSDPVDWITTSWSRDFHFSSSSRLGALYCIRHWVLFWAAESTPYSYRYIWMLYSCISVSFPYCLLLPGFSTKFYMHYFLCACVLPVQNTVLCINLFCTFMDTGHVEG